MFVICVNDFPFVIANVDEYEQAEELQKRIQDGFDNRKDDVGHGRKVNVHLRTVPVIEDISQIEFPQWVSQRPIIREKS